MRFKFLCFRYSPKALCHLLMTCWISQSQPCWFTCSTGTISKPSMHRSLSLFQQPLVGCLVQVQDAARALTDDLEMVTVVASIKREIETPGAGIAKQIRVLVALVRVAVYQHLLLINMKPVARTRQDDVAARCVVIPRDGEVQKTFILGIRFGQDRGPARVGP